MPESEPNSDANRNQNNCANSWRSRASINIKFNFMNAALLGIDEKRAIAAIRNMVFEQLATRDRVVESRGKAACFYFDDEAPPAFFDKVVDAQVDSR